MESVKFDSITQRYFYDDTYESLLKWKRDGLVPENLGRSSQYEFRGKYKAYFYDANIAAICINAENPITKQIHKLIAVKRSDVDSVLQSLYSNPATMFISINSGIEACKYRYVGITAADIRAFLAKKRSYQLHQPIPKLSHKVINRPILTESAFERLYIDLFDMQKYATFNNNYKFVLVCVDKFTKYTYTFALKNKGAKTICDAIEPLLTKETPKYLCSDNGPEFKNEDMKSLCEKIGIVQIFSSAYHPQSNGTVENVNKTLKNYIFNFMTEYGTKKYIDILASITESYNNRKHSQTGYSPYELMNTKLKTPINNVIVKQNKAALAAVILNEKIMPDDINVGDYVRILKTTAIRDEGTGKRAKPNIFTKSYETSWSKAYYKVMNISLPKGYTARVYTIENPANKLTQQKYRNELLRIDKPAEVTAADRPIVDNSFNLETHLKSLHEQRRGSKKQHIKPQLDEEPPIRMTRSMTQAHKQYNLL